ncbi:N-acetylmuramoyl-L-alanine amidase [Mesobacillus persicus]|uniref:N-acetylmuramoyl-L-alanine amidase n=1 Tax=Mesobacillus persicus TaxID=930146 RepID=A0A1H7XDV4_9BACI|nr:SH3 domain-containing protein [Mesobacillus persicus]SEM31863.1 N-acetylmuramoyl-L-alanine amidase [Mesobacillus persicus]
MLNKKMATIFVCLLLIITGSIQKAVPAEAQNGFVTITASNLNVREGPGLSYSIMSKVNKGERFPIVKEEGDWIKIGLSAGRQGWVANWYTTKDSADNSLATGGTTGTVTADSLRVRTGPGTSHSLAGSLTHGQKVTIKELSGNWVKISLNSFEGWVSKEYLSMSTTQQANSQSGKKEAVVTAGLNVRTSPSVSSNKVGTLAKGSRVIVNSQANGWSQINYNGTNSWVSSQYLNFSVQTQNTTTASATTVVTASSLYVRDQGSLNGKVVGQVVKGQTFTILAETNNWLKIEYENGKTGWAAGWFFDKSQTNGGISTSAVKNQTITILSDGTNIRNDAGVDGAVIQRATKGETYEVTNLNGDWYQIHLSGGKTGYIAGWIVSLNGSGTQIEKPDAGVHTKNKTIVIDPGHGGNDSGTIGARGTHEKDLNLKTAKLLHDKLKAAGANVHMTRTSDKYVSLASRVSTSHYRNADAFISIHYDSISDKSVRGMTTYYYYGKGLASELHSGVINRTQLKNRDVRYGNYYVLRENKQSSALLELGYLSNPTEEMLVSTNQYQQTVADGLFEGLARYFKTN